MQNLGYAQRLGLWGGTDFPFATRADLQAIDAGGIAAMEVLARDLKALGLYAAPRRAEACMSDFTLQPTHMPGSGPMPHVGNMAILSISSASIAGFARSAKRWTRCAPS